MSDISPEQLEKLSPAEKRKLLAQLLEQKAGRPKVFPLSFAQQRFWFLDQLEPGTSTFNMPVIVRLRGKVDAKALEKSLNEIVRRHASLRTTFGLVDDQPAQIIAPTLALTMPIIDLAALPEARREDHMRRLTREESERPFDLSTGPLLRTDLLRLTASDCVLAIVMHHIISDGWSVGVFIHELTTLYHAFSQGKASPLPELPIQYTDFAAWQRDWLQGQRLASQLDYWKRQLGGDLPVLDLPTDRSRAAAQTFRGRQRYVMFPKSTSNALKEFSQREGVTLFMTLLAAFKVLLSRYANQTDVVVGTPIANRNRKEIENLIGFFVNTLVLRTDLSGDPTFRELVQRVRRITLDAYAHQDLPFEKLVEALHPERDLRRTPLFQVLFVLQNAPIPQIDLSDLRVSVVDVPVGIAQFDLTWNVVENARGLSSALEYNGDLFEEATIQRIGEHLQTLLQGITADPDRRISELPILPDDERQRLLVEWSRTRYTDAPAVCLHQLFEAQVERMPDVVAVVLPVAPWTSASTGERSGWGGGEHLTYRELNRRANQLAHHLRALGVGPEARVGVCLDRSPDMIIGLLAILKAGGAYVPLDPAYPDERLIMILRESGAHVALTQAQLADRLSDYHGHIVSLDRDRLAIAREPDGNLESRARPDNLAYIIYTSGSTGAPKGVMVEHRSLVNYTRQAWSLYGLTAGDRLLQFASISWDTSAEEIYPCLTQGGSLVLRTESMLDSAARFWAASAAWALNVMNPPTAYWHELVAALRERDVSLPPSVRLMLIGGEAVLEDRVRVWLRHTRVPLVNEYGVTEATAVTTQCDLVTSVSASDRDAAPIGRPIGNVQVYVLDRRMQPAPMGVPGELYIGGDGLARGYLNRPELTAEKFMPDPFTDHRSLLTDQLSVNSEQLVAGNRLYKTGDLVRWRSDGLLEFIGRIDWQVKVRGHRVELAEIEEALNALDEVHEAIVLAHGASPGGAQLAAYVILRAPDGVTPGELRDRLRKRLPDYMLPSRIIFLDALPLTTSGKIDRRALPAPEKIQPASSAVAALPRTPIEETLAGIWAEVLNLDSTDDRPPFGIHDNFFDLGGHSLLATQLVSRIQNAFHLDLSLRTIFQSPTVAGLAEAIASMRADDDEAKRLSLLDEIENLSEEEAERLFAAERQSD